MKKNMNDHGSASKIRKLAGLVVAGALAFAVMSQTAKGQTDDPLHGVCIPTCTDNGTNSPTSTNPPTFGFTVSPGPASGSLLLVFLVPSTAAQPASIGVTGALAGTATLFSATPWTSGKLDTYLGISASPANGIGAYLAGGSSYDVYDVNVGTKTLQNPSNAAGTPYGTVMGGLPMDSYIVGFLNEGTASAPDWIATANSGAILETGPEPPPVPEPTSLILLGTSALGLAGVVRRRYHN